MKPILFNTEMVQAILDDRKSCTRRIVKPHRKAIIENMWIDKDDGDVVVVYNDNYHIGEKGYIKPPCKVEDILYVRETWQCLNPNTDKWYIYKATPPELDNIKWLPSIHMPKSAARIFLRVTGIRIERLHDITEAQAKAEGIRGYTKDGELYKYCVNDDDWIKFHRINSKKLNMHGSFWQDMPRTPQKAFEFLWNSTIKKPNLDHCGWDANPWVWIIEFERVDKDKLDGRN